MITEKKKLPPMLARLKKKGKLKLKKEDIEKYATTEEKEMLKETHIAQPPVRSKVVYVLVDEEPYEGATVLGVFDSVVKVGRAKSKLLNAKEDKYFGRYGKKSHEPVLKIYHFNMNEFTPDGGDSFYSSDDE